MKKLFATFVLCFSSFAIAQSVFPGVASSGQLGSFGIGRQDAQIEARNDTGGHALISIFNARNPGDTKEEAAINYGAYDSAGTVRQVASISAIWSNNATPDNGYGVLRFNVDAVNGMSDIFMRGFPYRGVTFFYDSDTQTCGARMVCIKRTPGSPSLGGQSDLVIEGKAGGTGTIYLNAYGGGEISLGGQVRFANSSVGCPLSVPAGVSHCIRIIAPDGSYSYLPAYR